MSVDAAEFSRWGELGEAEKLEGVLAILRALPVMDQLKLLMYLTSKVPQLCETKFFVEFAKMHHDLELIGGGK
jgi:hypothetical protein